jgi:phenylalanyl-tRNA synthetase beta chain
VARLHGYDAIPATPATMPQRPAPASEGSVRRDRVLALLADRGYQEAITYSFIPEGLQSLFAPDGAALALSNPISSDLAVMRRSLWPGLVIALRDNLRRQQERVRLVELGTRFETGSGDMIERLSLAGLAWGEAWPEQWATTARPVDFYDVKADLVALLSLARPVAELAFIAAAPACLHPGRSARIEAEGHALGWIGELHPHISSQLELKNPPILFELDFDSSFDSQLPQYKELSRFPTLRRDLAVVVADEISLAQIRESVSVSAGSALQELRVFDIYRGQGIEPGRKSVALGLILQETSRTLTDAEADQVVAAVVARLKSDQNATIRD